MSSVLSQLSTSTLSLPGNGLTATPTQPAWGYPDSSGDLLPEHSSLQDTYSVDGNPNVRIVDFNRAALGGVTSVRPPASLDELDRRAPNNIMAGMGGVVSQVYKSPSLQQYRTLGPQPGRY
jgi:hypothetical protein